MYDNPVAFGSGLSFSYQTGGAKLSVPYRVTVRISEETMEKLEELVSSFQYENVSDIIRKAIDEFIERNYSKGPTSKVDVILPRKILKELENDVSSGAAINLEDLIRVILRDYTLKRVNQEIDEISSQENVK